jgi:molybdate transport system substrate-binding protein
MILFSITTLKKIMGLGRLVATVTALVLPLGAAYGAQVSVAVAANFSAPMKIIAQEFEGATGHKAVLAFGATGQFYAQIRNGAPFEVLLAADSKTPARLENEKLGVAETRFTYAKGRLVLWSKKPGVVDHNGDVLRSGQFDRLAIANPKLAPYGAAAMEVLEQMGLARAVVPKLVQGASIAQAFQFVSSGNADLGFIALSQVFRQGKIQEGSGWIIPSSMHTPIEQDAILLNRGKGNPAAEALMQFLRGDKAKAVLLSFGYEL